MARIKKRMIYHRDHDFGDAGCAITIFIIVLGIIAGLAFASATKSIVVTKEGTITKIDLTETMDESGNLYDIYDITIDNLTRLVIKQQIHAGIQHALSKMVGDHVFVYHEEGGMIGVASDNLGNAGELNDARQSVITWNSTANIVGWVFVCIAIFVVILAFLYWLHESVEITNKDENDSFHVRELKYDD